MYRETLVPSPVSLLNIKEEKKEQHCHKKEIKKRKKKLKGTCNLVIVIWIQGVPKNMGIQWRIRYRLCYELALIPNFKCLLEFILWKG